MARMTFKNVYTLMVPVVVEYVLCCRWVQITRSVSTISMRFESEDDPNIMRELRARRYGLRVNVGRWSWATYIEKDMECYAVESVDSSWALAQ